MPGVPDARGGVPTSADQARIQEAERLIRAVPHTHPIAIVPVGSRAIGTARPDSDLDLVVLLPDAEVTRENWGALYRALTPLNGEVDVLVYGPRRVAEWSGLTANPLRHAFEIAGLPLEPLQ